MVDDEAGEGGDGEAEEEKDAESDLDDWLVDDDGDGEYKQQLLEEKRQLVATRGRAGGTLASERESIEVTLRQGYEDRLQELEEMASSSGAIKKQLQAELERTSARLRDENECLRQENARLRGPLRALG